MSRTYLKSCADQIERHSYPALKTVAVDVGYPGPNDEEPVLVVLEPGESWSYENRWATDEGWKAVWMKVHYAPTGVVHFEKATSERDCDGLMDWLSIESRIASENLGLDGLPIDGKNWEEYGRTQRDHSAEAMGY